MAPNMQHSVLARLRGLLAALIVLLGTLPASANNIPGSAATALPEETEIATGMIVRSIKAHVVPLREGTGGAVVVSTSGRVSGAGFVGGDMPLAFGYDHRDLDTGRLDGSLGIGTLFLGHAIDGRTLVFGGLLAERLDADTPYNSGRIEADGIGIAVGVDHRAGDRLFLTGILGLMEMDYDVSRGNGAVTGSFGARRSFVDLSGDYVFRTDPAEITLGFGLLYVNQKNDAYTESGGTAVAGFTSDQLSGKLSARSAWGRPGELRPYLDAETWFRLAGSSGLPAVLDPGDDRDWSGRLGLGLQQSAARSGFDLGLGSNFGDDGFEGLDARFSYTVRF